MSLLNSIPVAAYFKVFVTLQFTRRAFCGLVWCCLLACLGGVVLAQSAQHTENKPDQVLRTNGRVNPSTLGMEMDLPLAAYPGRGGSVPLGLSYSSKVWRMEFTGSVPRVNNPGCASNNDPRFGEDSAAGWTSTLSAPYVEYTGRDNLFNDNGFPLAIDCNGQTNSNFNNYIKRIQIHLPGGESHELRAQDTPLQYSASQNPVPDFNGWFYATDGTNLKYYENAATNAFYLLLPDGSRYDFNTSIIYESNKTLRYANTYKDRNGNRIDYHGPTTAFPNGYWTDTMGRNLGVPLPKTAPTDPVTQTFTIPGFGTYKFYWKKLKDSSAADSAILDFTQTLKYKGDLTVSSIGLPGTHPAEQSLFHSGSANWAFDNVNELFNPVLLTAVELPNYQQYRFSYNVFGEIERIQYPTGGEEKFTQATVPSLNPIEDYG